jgi:glyoxylate reductase
MPALKVLAVAGAGTDAVDTSALESLNIRLISAPNTTAAATAELTICLTLAVSRGILRAANELAKGNWEGWSFDHIVGRSLSGLTMGLVGYGHIGRRVASLASTFGMEVLHHTRRDTLEPGYVSDLETLLTHSDIVSLHVPLTSDTFGLIGVEALAAMKTGAALINTSRGGVVDEIALGEALRAGHLSGAALDVFAAEPSTPWNLLDIPNLLITPHIGTSTASARSSMVEEASTALMESINDLAL